MKKVLPAWLMLIFLPWGAVQGAEEETSLLASIFNQDETDEIEPGEGTRGAWNEFELDDIMDFTLHGDLWLYHIRTANTYHTDRNAALTEVTARLGVDFTLKQADWISGQLRWVRTEVHDRPDNWTAPARTDAGDRFDLANVTASGHLGSWATSVTVGLQEIVHGDGFLIYDGYSDKRAVWTTPINSFSAVRWTLTPNEAFHFDLFAAEPHEDRITYEALLGSGVGIEGGGQVYGAQVNHPSETLGDLSVGLYYKDEDIRPGRNNGLDSDSDTWALSVRDSIDVGPLNFTAEIVKEWGRTRVVRNSVTPGDSRRNRDAWGGHFTTRYHFTDEDDSPYLSARYAYFQGDRKGSRKVEGFDPFFYGFYDWGYWYLGDMTSYSLTNTNEQCVSLEFGFVPVEKTRFRLFLYDFFLDQELDFSSSEAWAYEINAIFDYYPWDEVFLGVMLGTAIPKSAAKSYAGDDEIQNEIILWAGISF